MALEKGIQSHGHYILMTLCIAKGTSESSNTYIREDFTGRKVHSVTIRTTFDLVEIRQSETIKI